MQPAHTSETLWGTDSVSILARNSRGERPLAIAIVRMSVEPPLELRDFVGM